MRPDNNSTPASFDLLLDEMPELHVRALGVYGRMRRGYSKEEALEHYGISEEEYDAVIDEALQP